MVADLGRLVSKAAPHDLPVSIYGETGTGKEKVASALHELSKRSSRKFVAINAASLSDELFESQLFGHVRGSFTSAQTDRPGLVEEAKGGNHLFTVDLETQTVTAPSGAKFTFEIDKDRKHKLLKGLDAIGETSRPADSLS